MEYYFPLEFASSGSALPIIVALDVEGGRQMVSSGHTTRRKEFDPNSGRWIKIHGWAEPYQPTPEEVALAAKLATVSRETVGLAQWIHPDWPAHWVYGIVNASKIRIEDARRQSRYSFVPEVELPL